jgi:hypothetical protein
MIEIQLRTFLWKSLSDTCIVNSSFTKEGQDTKIVPEKLRLLKSTNMTIHWKALEEHFLMAPLVFRFNSFSGGKSIFSQKNLSLKSCYCFYCEIYVQHMFCSHCRCRVSVLRTWISTSSSRRLLPSWRSKYSPFIIYTSFRYKIKYRCQLKKKWGKVTFLAEPRNFHE